MTKKIAGLLFAIFIPFFIQSQTTNPCGTVEMDEAYSKQDQDIINIKKQLEDFTQDFVENKKGERQTYVIPVVFHIIHDGGVENIPKSKIETAIKHMNEDFSATNSDLRDVIPQFENIIGAADIVTRLAKIDPDGNCTEGITRTRSEATYMAGDNVKFIAPAWPRDKYLNIWVVYSIGSGAAAYSNYPSSVANNPAVDGVVTKYNYVGNPSAGRHTLTHEVGHYLNLIHPWGSTNEPTISTNCQIDDQVDDTPNTIGSAVGACVLSQTTCGSLDNVQNIMDYSGCDNMFTQGQVDRMHAAINSTISSRNNLWSEQNLIETGTNDAYVITPCSPIAGFVYNQSFGCQGMEITFADFSYNATVSSRLWSFPGGIPSTSTDSVVTILYENPGLYDVTIEVNNNIGTSLLAQAGLIKIIDTTSGYRIPLTESFESEDFNTIADKTWEFINKGSGNWTQTTDAAFAGESSLRIKNYLNGTGVVNTIISPNINISELVEDELSFRMAYARKSESNADELKIFFSRDCGKSWALKYLKSGSSLSSNLQTELFIPEPEDWQLEKINLSSISSWNHLMVKIQITSFGGNALYIDDLKITEKSTSSLEGIQQINEIKVYPNPVDEASVLLFDLNNSSEIEIVITDIIGKEIYRTSDLRGKGMHKIKLHDVIPNIKAGTYLLNVSGSSQTKNIKFIIL